MIASILPAPVVAVECRDDPPDAFLFPEEEASVARAVDRRRQEFTTVRHCARLAMMRLGIPPAAVVPGPQRSPTWPAGVVGSMTHCTGYRAAALAHASDLLSVGIDAEPHEPLPEGVDRLVVMPDEQDRLARLSAVDPHTHWGRILFSAKESVFKAWFPLTASWLGFEDASVTIDVSGTFSARLSVPGPMVAGIEMREFAGRWTVRDGLALTAVTVPPSNCSI